MQHITHESYTGESSYTMLLLSINIITQVGEGPLMVFNSSGPTQRGESSAIPLVAVPSVSTHISLCTQICELSESATEKKKHSAVAFLFPEAGIVTLPLNWVLEIVPRTRNPQLLLLETTSLPCWSMSQSRSAYFILGGDVAMPEKN